VGDWPTLSDGALFADIGTTLASSAYKYITAGQSNVKGSWIELISSTSQKVDGFWFSMELGGASGCYLIDIGIGAADYEIPILTDLFYSRNGAQCCSYFPLPIPAGTRVSARAQYYTTGAAGVNVGILLQSVGFLPSPVLSRCITYGADEATTLGVAVDAGAVAHTKGAWTEIIASTTNPIKMLFAINGMDHGWGGYYRYLFDIGIGSEDSEIVVVPNRYFKNPNTGHFNPNVFGPFPVNIPAGSRLAVRMQASTTDAADRVVSFVLYGVD
jgi:hypothetical protein